MIPVLFSLVLALAQPAPGAAAAAPLVYQFDQVEHSVHLRPGGDPGREVAAAIGTVAAAGDGVRTGWLGRAWLSVPSRATRFELAPSTEVRLADGEPGVLLVVERGRIKALFDKLLNGDTQERRVRVPGALLAVRGTRYGIEVDRGGRTELMVFEGVVEVFLHSAAEPVRIKAGQWAAFGPRGELASAPRPAPGMTEQNWAQGQGPGRPMANGTGGPMPGSGPGGLPGPQAPPSPPNRH
jgi:hypothetical protein